MTLPGSVITQRDQTPPRTPPTDTGVWFAAGLTERGPATATAIKSLEDFKDTYGDRVSYSVMFDAIETFFKEGGGTVYVARVLGAAPIAASVSLSDATPATTLKVSAKSAGEWGNSLNVAVIAGGTAGEFVLVVTHDTLGEVERSPSLADTSAAITWSQNSDWVTASELPGTGDPAVIAAQSMTAGTDDRASVTNVQRVAALDLFTKDLGPGQVSIPGQTHLDVHTGLLTHAQETNRVALLDVVDSTSASTITAQATAIRGLAGNLDRHGAVFAPWAVIPGYVGGTTTRTVPYSAIEAGLIARSDALTGNPNVPAAGENGKPVSVLELTADFTDTERESLNDGGVNVARLVYEVPKTYGFRSVGSSSTAPLHWQFSNVRMDMGVVAQAEVIAERYVFKVIDGKGLTISQFGGELSTMLRNFYEMGALYGIEPDDAFRVDVGSSVNTPESIAEGRLRAVLSIRRSPFAERVEIEIVKVATTDTV